MKKEKKLIPSREVISDYIPYLIIILVVIIIRTFIATPIKVNGPSMFTTLEDGDIMILNKIGYKVHGLKRFDIVVVKTDKKPIIKRIIAFPGESVSYIDGKLYINEKEVEDKYSLSETADFDEVKLKDDEYFVMGDNRILSQDSRIIGPIKKDQILGKTNIILYPFSKIGIVKD